MRRLTRGTWAVAVTTALALTSAACGGGDGSSGSGGGGGVVRASWGEPQNPLEPANTNEVQGGKVLDMVFTGLVRYNPDTAKAENAMAKSIKTDDQQTFTVKVKKGWKFQDGTPVTAHSFVDAWNYGALLSNNQINAFFFQSIDGYDQVHPATGKACRPEAVRAEGHGRLHLHRQAQPEILPVPPDTRVRRLLAAAEVVLQRPRQLALQAGRKRPVQDRLVHARAEDEADRVQEVQGSTTRRRTRVWS